MRSFLILLTCILLLSLAACAPYVILLTAEPESGPAPSTAGQEPTPSEGQVPTALPLPAVRTPYPTPTLARSLGARPDGLQGVEVQAWHGWDGPTASLFEQMAAEFNLSNAWGIKVKVAPQPNLTSLGATVGTVLGQAAQPDLVVAMPEQILAWQAQLLDLAPYAADHEVGFHVADLPPAFGGQSSQGEVRYALPAARSGRYLFYNQSFARELGFTAAPGTPEEFRTQACAANAFWKQDADLSNDGFGGLALETSPNWQTPYAWLSAGGGSLYSGGDFTFNSAANLNALNFVADLRADDCAWLPDGETGYAHLVARRALFLAGSLSELAGQTAAFTEAGSSDEWTVLPFPGAQPTLVTYGPDYALFKSSPERELAAWLFLRWMLEPQNQVRWSRSTGLLPVTRPAAELLKNDPALSPQWRTAMMLAMQATVTYPQSAEWGLVEKVFGDGFNAYYRSYPNVPLADVLEVMDVTVQDLISK
jgi:multiple sugar transport system substrate-binding protein